MRALYARVRTLAFLLEEQVTLSLLILVLPSTPIFAALPLVLGHGCCLLRVLLVLLKKMPDCIVVGGGGEGREGGKEGMATFHDDAPPCDKQEEG